MAGVAVRRRLRFGFAPVAVVVVVAGVLVLVQPTMQRWLRSRGIDPTSLPRRALIPVLPYLLGLGGLAAVIGNGSSACPSRLPRPLP